MGSATVVFELGYDDAMELFLRGLGGCGLPGSHHPDCLPGGAAQKQHNPAVVCATSAVTSRGHRATVGRSGTVADRGFADGKLLKYLQQTLKWHFRIRIKKRFQFQTSAGRWHKISDIQLAVGEALSGRQSELEGLLNNHHSLEALTIKPPFIRVKCQ
jgi:hypothetical protein